MSNQMTPDQPRSTDPARFPAFTLAYRALERGGTAPAALSGADEAAVEAFLVGRIPFPRIAALCAEVLDAHVPEPVRSVEQALAASEWGRREAAVGQREGELLCSEQGTGLPRRVATEEATLSTARL